jgi:iron complex transport system permease protein
MARAWSIWLMLALGVALALIASLALGSVPIHPSNVLKALARQGDPLEMSIVLDLRLPRAVAAFACGGLLALAGAMMQVLLRNPLADPYVLGVSGGSAVGAFCAMFLALPWVWIHVSAAAGALGAMLLVAVIARQDLGHNQAHGRPQESGSRLLLTGVILAAGWSALITLMLTMAPEAQLRGLLFWLTGDLTGADSFGLSLVTLLLVLGVIVPIARHLNVLMMGDTLARGLGIPVARLRILLYLGASLATAAAVTTAGAVGFIGLLVPHMVRLAWGNDQRVVLPAAVLLGGLLLMLADLLARTMIAPAQLPVGVITTMLGVPAFLFLLLRRA